MNTICSRRSSPMPAASTPTSSMADRRGGGGSRSLRELVNVELLEQRLECRREMRDLHVTGLALRDEIDQQRDAGAVAVVDVGRIDDDAPSGSGGDRAAGLRPTRAGSSLRRAVRTAQDAPAVRSVRNRERRHQRSAANAA